MQFFVVLEKFTCAYLFQIALEITTDRLAQLVERRTTVGFEPQTRPTLRVLN